MKNNKISWIIIIIVTLLLIHFGRYYYKEIRKKNSLLYKPGNLPTLCKAQNLSAKECYKKFPTLKKN